MGQFTALQNPQFQVIHSLLNDYRKEGKNMISTYTYTHTHTHTHTHARARARARTHARNVRIFNRQTFRDYWGHQRIIFYNWT